MAYTKAFYVVGKSFFHFYDHVEIIVFKNLVEEDYKKIAHLMLSEYIDTLAEKGIELRFDDKACEFLAHKSFNGNSGARDLRNIIRKDVEDKITEQLILAGEGSLSAISISATDSELVVNSL